MTKAIVAATKPRAIRAANARSSTRVLLGTKIWTEAET
ncbi:hypothetical protein AA0119_g8159 [Alternaria tenuissima]|uniref:Uncharacterized protein n=2 Tax=Alternaria alternata complex TaxID=187734 RepID=A0A4Q4NMT7_ALTAL|nr:hypothetical protein AA0115_g3089 [Alternaria tenuissima]RYN80082.1 hypothetical protein AA0117_g3063 [Alternaria alternata]RYN53903.1 hypothetical protein AA0114_g4147 [Alternaria tenuissima]RYN84872.1 hypothetical protein AA0120_g8964 [Alternaria tenuissima]RYN96627.1 hypothetical protein AA0119_g8159 [Alternaria tenuissima]